MHVYAVIMQKVSYLDQRGVLRQEYFRIQHQVLPFTRDLYHRDDALLYIAYVMLIWAAPIPADRWHCSLWP